MTLVDPAPADAPVDDVDGPAADATTPRPRSSRLLRVGLAVFALLLVVRLFVAEPVRTDGSSMEPTLHDGDMLVIDTLSYRFVDPKVGDIVVATTPDTGQSVVKRVVAVGGDLVGIEDGVLMRNGRAVDEPYANQEQMGGYYWGPVTVPDGELFLLGDNRLDSVDSRTYGTVSIEAVEGRYVSPLWPR